jgi:hypothetical protein
MNIREILAALDQLRALYAACGPKAAEKNIAKVIELLAPHDGKPIEAFIMDVRAAATSAEARTAAPATAVVTKRWSINTRTSSLRPAPRSACSRKPLRP